MEIEQAQSSNKMLKGDKGKFVINIDEERKSTSQGTCVMIKEDKSQEKGSQQEE